MSLSKKAILEIQELSSESERLAAAGGASNRARSQILSQRISSIKLTGLSSDEVRALYAEGLVESLTPKESEHRTKFERYVAGRDEGELRDFLSGTQAVTWTQGPAGGYSIPLSYDSVIRAAKRQTAPLADENLTDFKMNPTPACNPTTVPSFDLSTIAGQVVGETVQQATQVVPAAIAPTLNSVTIRATLSASLEIQEDASDFTERVITAGTVALMRSAMLQVLAGSGSGGNLTGVVKSLTSSISNGTAGKVVLGDLNSIFYAVDAFWRASKRCFWACSDATAKFLSNAVDSQGRPLIDVTDGITSLMGKPILICPELATSISGVGAVGALLFGSGDGILVRMGRPTLQRVIQSSLTDITKGEAAFIFRLRLQSQYYDASVSAANPPLVMAAIS